MDIRAAKRIVLIRYPKAFVQSFSGLHLVDGVQGIALSDSRKYANDLNQEHWVEAAKRIMEQEVTR
jgi:hypothetical protein